MAKKDEKINKMGGSEFQITLFTNRIKKQLAFKAQQKDENTRGLMKLVGKRKDF